MKSAARLFGATVLVAMLSLVALAPVPASAGGATCGPRHLSQPFLRWLDGAHYFLLPGGNLETTAGWTVSGGARLVAGNEPFYAHDPADRHSLFIPSGGSARTSPTCVDSDEPTMRFFVRNTGSALSLLTVEARVRTTVLGLTTETTVPVGVVSGTAKTWQPSLPAVFSLSLNQLLGGVTTVDFRFTAVGFGGQWYVDDVYIDPFKDR